LKQLNGATVMKYLLATIILLLPLSTAFGIGGGRGFEDGLFFGSDLDRNERLDRDEAKNVYNLAEDEVFNRFDEDSNNQINRAEFREFLQLSPWTDKFVHPSDK
jgi:hypothetical protein